MECSKTKSDAISGVAQVLSYAGEGLGDQATDLTVEVHENNQSMYYEQSVAQNPSARGARGARYMASREKSETGL